ncbi:MAG: AraC family transcriptional regulator [Deltaproteobacteria bacterium]|nr:AraC family transcriptional regulator [Deltaproteobacteria bacterium]
MKQPTASVDFFKSILRVLARWGYDPEEIYETIGFDPSILHAGDARISLTQFNAFFSEALKRRPDSHFGLHIGENDDFTMDILHVILFNSSTLGHALRNFCRYYNLGQDICRPVLTIRQNSAELVLEIDVPDLIHHRHYVEGHLAYYFTLISLLANEKVALDRVQFVHPSPDDTLEHERIFQTLLLFGQSENKIVFNKNYLDLPIRIANSKLLKSLEMHAIQLQKGIYHNDTVSSLVEDVIMKALPFRNADIVSVSKKMGMSPRKLQSHLKKEGARYRDVLDKVKRNQAEYFLEQQNLSIIDISFLLGYSEQSAFNRAFKKWTGHSPGEYRFKKNHLRSS